MTYLEKLNKILQDLDENGYWTSITNHPGKMGRASQKRRKKGEMSFIRDTNSVTRFKKNMGLI